MQIPEPNSGETGPFASECLFMLAQLRHMLAAEQSAIVAKESKDRRAFRPQRADSNRVAFGIGHNDIREFPTERFGHRETL